MREEEEIPQGMPRATPTLLLPVCGLYRGWSPRGKEAKILLKKLSLRLAEKWEKPYSEACGFVNARMSIAIVKTTHLCLHGSRIPRSKMCNRLPQWEDKAGLGRFRRY